MRGPDVEEFCCRKLHGTGALCKKSQALYQDCREDTAVTVHSKTLQGRDSERRCNLKRQAKYGEKTGISPYQSKGKKTGMKIKTGKVSDLDRQAAKRHFIETMLQPGAGAKMKEQHVEKVDKQKGDQLTFGSQGRVRQLGVRMAEDHSKIHQPAESSQWVWRMAQN